MISNDSNIPPFEWVNAIGTKMFKAEYLHQPNRIVLQVVFKDDDAPVVYELCFQRRGRSFLNKELIKRFCENSVNNIPDFDRFADWRSILVTEDIVYSGPDFNEMDLRDVEEAVKKQLEALDLQYNSDLN